MDLRNCNAVWRRRWRRGAAGTNCCIADTLSALPLLGKVALNVVDQQLGSDGPERQSLNRVQKGWVGGGVGGLENVDCGTE